MKLVIISHTPHYQKERKIVGWGPTVREINYLTKFFEEIVHIAPLHTQSAPESSLPYESGRVRFRGVPPSGGSRFWDKLGILGKVPVYLNAMFEEFRGADVIHVRCPANISMLAIVLLAWMKNSARHWIKYAGNWRPDRRESWSYTFQRWWLKKNLARSIVTVNGEWPDQPKHIYSFLNPCLTAEEIKEAEILSKDKKLTPPVQLLFVGRLETEKGVSRCLEIAGNLSKRGIVFYFDFIGDGANRKQFEKIASDMAMLRQARFHGWLSRKELNVLYAKAHFLLLPTTASEGWPKVISEAMTYGVVPLAGAVGCITHYLGNMKTGKTFKAQDVEGFASAIQGYIMNPLEWEKESRLARQSSARFSYEHYLNSLKRILFKKGSP